MPCRTSSPVAALRPPWKQTVSLRRLLRAGATSLVALILSWMPPAASAAPQNEIEAVLLEQGYASGYGGAITVVYRPRVLFRDGRYTADAARALEAAPPIDGRWQRSGPGWTLTGRDGKTKRIEAKMRARPAPPGATLTGAYRRLSGVGGAPMNVPVVAAWKNLQFFPDGTVQTAQGAGADAGKVFTHDSRSARPRYRLDGHTIEFAHADGRSERRLFYFFPDGDKAIGVGASTLTRRR